MLGGATGTQMDTAVVARCGRVFDHLVASGQDVRPAMYNLYMKVCFVSRHCSCSNLLELVCVRPASQPPLLVYCNKETRVFLRAAFLFR